MKRLEMVVNAVCEGGVVLARVRSVNNKVVADFPTFRLQDSELKGISKGDGLIISTDEVVQKGNYISSPNYKILDKHITGKRFDLNAAIADSLVEEAPIF